MQRCANMLRSRRLTSRLQLGEHPSDQRSEHEAMGTHSSGQHAKGGEGYSVQQRPKPRPCCRGAGHDEGRKRVRKGFQGRNSLRPLDCLRFLSGLFYIVVVSDGFQTSLNTIFTNHSGFLPRLFKPE